MRTIREFSQEHFIDMVWNKDHGVTTGRRDHLTIYEKPVLPQDVCVDENFQHPKSIKRQKGCCVRVTYS